MKTTLQALQPGGGSLAPIGEQSVHALYKGDELRMPEDGRFDGLLIHGQIEVAGAVLFEERPPQIGANVPVGPQRIDVRRRDAAAQMALDVLKVFRLLAVNVARDVQVVFVALDFVERNHARIFWNL